MKAYHSKASSYLITSKSLRTEPYAVLKDKATQLKLTAFHFVIWYDYTLIDVAKLDCGAFSCVLDLIENKHIKANYIKNFRLACILMQRFLDSDITLVKEKSEDYLKDFPEVEARLITTTINADFTQYYNYDRVKANKIMFPFFSSRGIDKDLIAELISRGFLAYDTRFNNLIFINRTDKTIVGVEKLGTGSKFFQRLDGKIPMCWHFWAESGIVVDFDKYIEKAVFFDDTINLLKHISQEGLQDKVLYCSLHNSDCVIDTYKNTLGLLSPKAEIEYIFLNKSKIDRFRGIEQEKVDKSIECDLPTNIDCYDDDEEDFPF